MRDLLTHTSGVVSGTISNFANRAVAAGPKETLADYIPRLGKVPLEFQPGTRWAYSAAAGFDVLSRIVEVASGMPIDRFLKQRLFDPLEMKDTSYIVPTGNPRLVTLYTRGADGLRPGQNPGFMNGVYFSGGGGLVSHGDRLRAVRADAGQRRRIERRQDPQSAARRADGIRVRARHAARPAAR